MDIFEFEIRLLSYKWLNEKYNLNFSEEEIINLVKITNKWSLTKKLTETTPEELKQITFETYTNYKKSFLEKYWDQTVWQYNLREYINRLEYELKVIKEMWYNTYFLIVQDYINRARKNNISVWPGRWSWWGSFLAYALGITDIDPLDYDLIFERFLNPARVSMPDIDTDFEDIKREDVVEYTKQKYWSEKIAVIWTYMTMAAKAAFKDVARVFGIAFEQSNKISWYITEKTIQKSIEENPELQETIEENENIKKILELAAKLEWTVRQIWVHACWVVIAPEEISQYTPVQYPPLPWWKKEPDTSRIISQYDGHFLEDIWLLKMDFLGLRNLSIIKNTIKIIKARKEKEWKKLDDIFKNYFETMNFYPPLDDKETYEKTFQIWETSWVFQFESDWMRAWLKKLKPNNINDIIAMVSLYRPWPMEFIPSYVARKHWEEKVEYMPKEVYNEIKEQYWEKEAQIQAQKLEQDLSPFMDVTYWIPVYQEQLMRIVQAVAWFSLAESDMLRRWVGKKIKEVIEQLKKEFIERATEKWYKKETCIYVYEKMIEPAANYSFNKSHAACYSLIAYQTAYLKAHYPIEFHAALLRSVEEDTEKLAKFIDELWMKWFEITPPDVNKSFIHVAAIDNKVNLWFVSIKWVWVEVAKTIQKERKNNWEFKNFEDFLKRCKLAINKKSLESLAKSWALDKLEDRNTILANIDNILNRIKNSSNNWWWLFDIESMNVWLNLEQQPKTDKLQKLFFEEETFKTFVSGHIFDWFFNYIKANFNFISMFKEVEDYGQFKIIWFIKEMRKIRKKWTFVTIEDVSWSIDIFLKETLDLKKYDIIILEGYKGKSISTKKIIKLELEELLEKAKKSNKYDQSEKIVWVRAKRNQSTQPEQNKEDKTKEDKSTNPQNTNIISKNDDNTDNKSEKKEKYFDPPEDIQIISQISQIIKENPWDKEIYIWTKKVKLSEKWVQQIKNVLKS